MAKIQHKVTCYMCDREATSKEHVPPACFFPESKDLPAQIDYRRNLITVPSCDEHNSKKSSDDEHLLLVLLAIGGNSAARQHFDTKGMRALRLDQELLKRLVVDPFPVLYDGQATIGFTIDKARFDQALDKVVRGVYFHHYKAKLSNDIHVDCPSFQFISENNTHESIRLRQIGLKSADLLKDQTGFGENQTIFYYQIFRDEPNHGFFARLVFYESVTVLAYNIAG